MTAPLPALVALRDAVGALSEAFPERTTGTIKWWTRLNIDEKQLPFTDELQLIDLWRALAGDLNASERLRMALTPNLGFLILRKPDGHTFLTPFTGDGSDTVWHPMIDAEAEWKARTLAVLNALIGKERE